MTFAFRPRLPPVPFRLHAVPPGQASVSVVSARLHRSVSAFRPRLPPTPPRLHPAPPAQNHRFVGARPGFTSKPLRFAQGFPWLRFGPARIHLLQTEVLWGPTPTSQVGLCVSSKASSGSASAPLGSASPNQRSGGSHPGFTGWSVRFAQGFPRRRFGSARNHLPNPTFLCEPTPASQAALCASPKASLGSALAPHGSACPEKQRLVGPTPILAAGRCVSPKRFPGSASTPLGTTLRNHRFCVAPTLAPPGGFCVSPKASSGSAPPPPGSACPENHVLFDPIQVPPGGILGGFLTKHRGLSHFALCQDAQGLRGLAANVVAWP